MGPMVQLSPSVWDLDHGPQAFRAIPDQASDIPDDIAIFLAALRPPAPSVPEQHHADGEHRLIFQHHCGEQARLR